MDVKVHNTHTVVEEIRREAHKAGFAECREAAAKKLREMRPMISQKKKSEYFEGNYDAYWNGESAIRALEPKEGS